MHKEPKYCKDCKWSKWSKPEENYNWNLRCVNPVVNSKDSWALSATSISGTNAREQRDRRWYSFPACGMAGKLWEEKFDIDSLLEN